MEEYPQRTKDLSMLRHLHQELNEAWHERQEPDVFLICRYGAPRAGVFVNATSTNITQELGMNGFEGIGLLERLNDDGYIHLELGHSSMNSRTYSLRHFTNKGLAAIGELPDPKEALIKGFEAALKEIEQDGSIAPEEKEKRINAGRQAIELVRVMATEIVVKYIVGC